jgi:hypothetical protein
MSDDDHHLRPRRTYLSTRVWHLPGGNEDSDLWAQVDTADDGTPLIRTTWVPSVGQRERIAAGENIELIVWGTGQPPVAVMLTSVPLGKAPDVER